MKIGFIGLGHMGNPMVKNLLKAGHSLKIYDLNSKAVAALVEEGAEAASSLMELVQQVEVVFTMLQTSEQVLQTCLDPKGLFSHAQPNLLYIDSSSIDISATTQLHQAAAEKNIAMLDSPVSGGVAGATAATLTIMVGGETEAFLRAQPLLQSLGKKVIHAGPAGLGQAAKICNNLILGISMVAVCEGFNLAEKLGLNAKTFYDISSTASGQCWSMTSYCPAPGILENAPSSHHYQPGFMAQMMLKDLRLALQAAKDSEARLPLGEETALLYELMVNQGQGELDFSAIMKVIQGEIG